MVVQTGGTVSNSLGTIGANCGTIGSVLVQGAGSTWTNTDQVAVGHNGTGTLEVRNGGTLDQRPGLRRRRRVFDRNHHRQRPRLDLECFGFVFHRKLRQRLA